MKAIKILALFLSVSSFLLGAKTDIYFANGITVLERDAIASSELLDSVIKHKFGLPFYTTHIRKVSYA